MCLSILYAGILFFLLTPGILVTYRKKYNKYGIALAHAVLFGLIYYFTRGIVRIEGFTNSEILSRLKTMNVILTNNYNGQSDKTSPDWVNPFKEMLLEQIYNINLAIPLLNDADRTGVSNELNNARSSLDNVTNISTEVVSNAYRTITNVATFMITLLEGQNPQPGSIGTTLPELERLIQLYNIIADEYNKNSNQMSPDWVERKFKPMLETQIKNINTAIPILNNQADKDGAYYALSNIDQIIGQMIEYTYNPGYLGYLPPWLSFLRGEPQKNVNPGKVNEVYNNVKALAGHIIDLLQKQISISPTPSIFFNTPTPSGITPTPSGITPTPSIIIPSVSITNYTPTPSGTFSEILVTEPVPYPMVTQRDMVSNPNRNILPPGSTESPGTIFKKSGTLPNPIDTTPSGTLYDGNRDWCLSTTYDLSNNIKTPELMGKQYNSYIELCGKYGPLYTPPPFGTTPFGTTTPSGTTYTPTPSGTNYRPTPSIITPTPSGITPTPSGITPTPSGTKYTPTPSGITPTPSGTKYTPTPSGITPTPSGTNYRPTPSIITPTPSGTKYTPTPFITTTPRTTYTTTPIKRKITNDPFPELITKHSENNPRYNNFSINMNIQAFDNIKNKIKNEATQMRNILNAYKDFTTNKNEYTNLTPNIIAERDQVINTINIITNTNRNRFQSDNIQSKMNTHFTKIQNISIQLN